MVHYVFALAACIVAGGDSPVPGPVTVCGTQWCYVVPAYVPPDATTYNTVHQYVHAYEAYKEAVTMATRSSGSMPENVCTVLGAFYWVLTHKPSFSDAATFFHVINGIIALTIKTIVNVYCCAVAIICALDRCQKFFQSLVTLVFSAAWFTRVEYVSLVCFGLIRINHIYPRCLAVGVAAFAFLRALDKFSTPWSVPLRSLRVALNAISPATFVVVLHYAIAAASFSFMQKAAAFVVVASWFLNGLHWCSRRLCVAFSYLTMLPFFWTYPKTLHVIIGVAVYACPHLMLQPDSVVQTDTIMVDASQVFRPPPTLCDRGQLVSTLSPPADGQCLCHCMAAAQNVLLYQNLSLQDKITAAYSVKADFLQLLRAKGKNELAARLGGTGPASYPDSEEFELLAEFLGGQVVLESTEAGEAGPIYYNAGRPRVVVLGHKSVLDGTGHSSMHYELKQSFLEPIAKPSYATTAEPSEEKLMSIHALKSRLDLPGASSNDGMWAARVRRFKDGRRKLAHYKPLPPLRKSFPRPLM